MSQKLTNRLSQNTDYLALVVFGSIALVTTCMAGLLILSMGSILFAIFIAIPTLLLDYVVLKAFSNISSLSSKSYTRTFKLPVICYDVIHTNGETTTVIASSSKNSGGFKKFYRSNGNAYIGKYVSNVRKSKCDELSSVKRVVETRLDTIEVEVESEESNVLVEGAIEIDYEEYEGQVESDKKGLEDEQEYDDYPPIHTNLID